MDASSWNDNDSRVDLDALDTDSEINENTDSSNDEQSIISDSSDRQREKYLDNKNSHRKIQNSSRDKLPPNSSHQAHGTQLRNDDSILNQSQSQSRSKKQASIIHKVPTDNSYSRLIPATRISTKSYDPFEGELISNQSSVKNQRTLANTNSNTNSSDYNNFYSDNYFKNEGNMFANYLRDEEEDDEDIDHTNCDDEYLLPSSNINDDNYSYDYISNVKKKPGDKLKTMWSMPIQNERQYKDLQIISEVSKLQNLTFFSESYVKNLEALKISQLGLLIDMVKLTDNSLDEFYSVWNNFNPIENEDENEEKDEDEEEMGEEGEERKGKKEGKEEADNNDGEDEIDTNKNFSTESNLASASSTKTLGSDKLKHDSIQSSTTLNKDIKNDINATRNDKVTWFDINNSEGFKLMEKHKQDILNDLDKINSSIDQIDSFTKSMWTGL